VCDVNSRHFSCSPAHAQLSDLNPLDTHVRQLTVFSTWYPVVKFYALVIGASSLLVACDPPQPLDRVELVSGLPRTTSMQFVDRGTAPEAQIRALIALPIRDSGLLDDDIAALYDPQSPRFRNYLSLGQWLTAYAPTDVDVAAISGWLESSGLHVARVASNRLLIEVTGSAADFDDTFATDLHVLTKIDDDEYVTFGTVHPLFAPADIAGRIESVLVADPAADDSELPAETGSISMAPPPDASALSVEQIARAYGFTSLPATGTGTTIAIVAGAAFKRIDVQSFWTSQGIERGNPLLIETMEPLSTRYTETTLDIEWSGALAPGAELLVFAGPDTHETSLVYTFNAAIADGRAQVVTDSFAHREDVTPRAIRNQYHASARMAAALGITVVAASGDSGEPDVPSSSPLVTSVGGTVLLLDAAGERSDELAWHNSGSGESLSFEAPAWQTVAGKRAVSDVAIAAGPYWMYTFGSWRAARGTSFSAPVFAAMIAVVDSARREAGKPPVGMINRALYTDPAVHTTLRDVVAGETSSYPAQVGWDYPTGWGAPDASALAAVLP
jgi:kumamolisin